MGAGWLSVDHMRDCITARERLLHLGYLALVADEEKAQYAKASRGSGKARYRAGRR